MELPDDVLLLVWAFAKPSKSYKMYVLVLNILVDKTPPFVRAYMKEKLKKAVRFHYDRFLPLFLKLERKHSEMVTSVKAFCANDTPLFQTEYKRKLKNFTSMNVVVLSELNKL
jgi:hypothetical protein